MPDAGRHRWRRRIADVRRRHADSVAMRGLLTCVREATRVDFGDFRRTTPVSRYFGLDRGRPVDRWYIEAFLDGHRADVEGTVLEFGDDHYARTFGGDRIAHVDVLYPKPGHARATVVADISRAPQIPDDRYDCVICTQVLQYVFDLPAAFATLRRILAPGGVLLASAPGISRISRADADAFGEYWRLTAHGMRRLAGDAFGGAVDARARGNVLSSIAFLEGLAAEELTPAELDTDDPDFETIVLLRAVKRP